jgi:hypothetical protein
VGHRMVDENPIVTWAVELTGSRGTLLRWERLFTDRNIALVEQRQEEGREEFFLHAKRFDDLTGSEIHGVAADLVRKMNSVVSQFGGAEPVSLGFCVPIYPDGSRGQRLVVNWSVPLEVVTAEGALTLEDTERAQVLRLLTLVEREEYIADALTFLDRGTWFDFYFACEVMGYDLGDEHKLMKKPWAKQHKLKLVKQNAHFYRHARPKRPSRELSLQVAQGLLQNAIREWLGEKQ